MDPKEAIERARAQEKRGQVDSAIQSYLRGGSNEDAARLLVAARRFAEAAPLLLIDLGDLEKCKGWNADKKKLALKTAICLVNAGDIPKAVDLFLKVGERARAVEALEKIGDYVQAARLEQASEKDLPNLVYIAPAKAPEPEGKEKNNLALAEKLERDGKLDAAISVYVELGEYGRAGRAAHKLKRPGQAAGFFAEGKLAYEAAVCFMEAGESRKCLDWLVQVPRDDKRYRVCSVNVVKLANELNVFDAKIDQFLTRFVGSGPQDDRELDPFYVLGRLFQKNQYLELAKDVYRKVLARDPGYRDTATRLSQVEAADAAATPGMATPSAAVQVTVAQQDAQPVILFSVQQPGGVPDLPPLPGRPPVPTYAPPPAHAVKPAPATPQPTSRSTLATAKAGPASAPSLAAVKPASSPPPASPAPRAPAAPAASGPVDVVEGEVVNGRYLLEKKIGQGGMAAVYRAKDLELTETLAIKFFSQLAADEAMVTRFKAEVTLSRQLNHPNIIRLYDIGTYGPFKYITMELLQGGDLNKHMGNAPLPFAHGIEILIQACHALDLVHEQGVIHRDIKPDNFFITDKGVLKVMDFGIAKRPGAVQKTVAGMIAGTPEYMSPEQINDTSSVTLLTDMYALGVLCYRMFTGVLPFTHKELMPLLVMHMTEEPRPPRAHNPKIPPALEALILKLLAKDPADRVQSCADLARELADVRRSLPRA